MGSVRSTKAVGTSNETANIGQPFKARAGYATVGDHPLDQKVEMTNWEQGHYINYKYGRELVKLARN